LISYDVPFTVMNIPGTCHPYSESSVYHLSNPPPILGRMATTKNNRNVKSSEEGETIINNNTRDDYIIKNGIHKAFKFGTGISILDINVSNGL
jgi:hypothetical protein